MWYKLVDKVAVPCDILDAEAMKHVSVGKTILPNGGRVSTVFLRLDHSFEGGEPILFESMYFPDDSFTEDDCVRYSTWEEAYEGHRLMVEKYGGVVSPKDMFDEDDDLFMV